MKKGIIIFTVALLGYTGFSGLWDEKATILEAQYPKVTEIYDTLTLKGIVVEKKRVNIIPQQNGVIEQLYVKTGQKVQKGERLFSMIADENESAIMVPNRFVQASLMNGVTGDSLLFQPAGDVVSPIDGMVMELNYGVGDRAGTIGPIMAISDLSQVNIVSAVGEENIKKLKESMAATVKVDAITDISFTGKIETIMPYATTVFSVMGTTGESAKTDVMMSVKDSGGVLKPGYTANVEVITDTRLGALVVPYQYILQDENNQEYVYILGALGRAVRRDIVTGYELEEYTEVVVGITPEDVILQPYDEILENSVKVKLQYEKD